MILETIKYTRFKGQPKEWGVIGCDDRPVRFGNFNLLVGKNAAGKSRTLSVLCEISNLFSGTLNVPSIMFSSVEYELRMKDGTDVYEYSLKIDNYIVSEEILLVNDVEKLNRSTRLLFSESANKTENFIVENDTLSVASLHNKDGYPFLEKLYEWGNALKLGLFTNQKEKSFVLDDIARLNVDSVLSSSSAYLLHAFWKGKNLFGEQFIENVKQDMTFLGYPIDAIDITKEQDGFGLSVKEEELDDKTTQYEMSQGMFRTMAFIIHLNLILISKTSACMLLDDLGEGLDFDRSKLLIDLIEKKIANSNLQIFITTNDRYIMNKIPLKFWSVIERFPKKSAFHNYYNSQEIFDDFRFTGLNNFDFIATDFYLTGFGENED